MEIGLIMAVNQLYFCTNTFLPGHLLAAKQRMDWPCVDCAQCWPILASFLLSRLRTIGNAVAVVLAGNCVVRCQCGCSWHSAWIVCAVLVGFACVIDDHPRFRLRV